MSERIQEALHVVVVAEQVKHHRVFPGLCEDDTALFSPSELKDTAAMDFADSEPGVPMWLADCRRTREMTSSSPS